MNKYHKRFLNTFTSENVIALFSRYKGASKEITESWGMLEAAKRVCQDIGKCFVIVVGDGTSPRTGAIFAYYTKAEVLAIDPAFNLAHWNEHFNKQTRMGYEPRRLKIVKDKLENMKIDCEQKPCIVVWPHSHADMLKSKIHNYSSRIDIAMPCCVPIPAKLMAIPHTVYDDLHVASPKRTIHIWDENQRWEGKTK